MNTLISDCRLVSYDIVDLKVIRAGVAIAGDVAQVIQWYRYTPLRNFNLQTAQELVRQGRAVDVIRFVQSLETGFSG